MVVVSNQCFSRWFLLVIQVIYGNWQDKRFYNNVRSVIVF